MKYYIYTITCNNPDVVNMYVGRTSNAVLRFRNHKVHCLKQTDRNLYNFINQNGGIDMWNFTIIEECETLDIFLGVEREQYYFNLFKPTLNTNHCNRSYIEWRHDNRLKYNKYVNEFIKRKNLYLKQLQYFNLI